MIPWPDLGECWPGVTGTEESRSTSSRGSGGSSDDESSRSRSRTPKHQLGALEASEFDGVLHPQMVPTRYAWLFEGRFAVHFCKTFGGNFTLLIDSCGAIAAIAVAVAVAACT